MTSLCNNPGLFYSGMYCYFTRKMNGCFINYWRKHKRVIRITQLQNALQFLCTWVVLKKNASGTFKTFHCWCELVTCFTDKLIDQMKPATGDHLEMETYKTVLQMQDDETTAFDFNRHALNGINSPAKHSVDQFLVFAERKRGNGKGWDPGEFPWFGLCVFFLYITILFSGIAPPLLLDL